MQPYVFAFADNGNITAKTDAGGKYIYHPTKINAVQYIKDYTSAIPPLQQDITYTPFLRPLKITEGVNELEYTYASDYERRKGVLRKSGAVENTRLYLGDYEINTDKNGVKTTIHYLSGGEAIVVKRDNAAFEYYFPYTDHLGSIVAVTSLSGTVVAEQNFDAWGRKRNPTNWSYDNVPSVPTWLYRGFTGHEHLAEFNLINMNARLYDPVLGRMLSPDNFVHGGTQGFNRYSYANNNPFKYTDPDGNFWHIIIGAVVGGVVNLAVKAFNGQIRGGWLGVQDAAVAFGIGAAGGAVTAATGGVAATAVGLGTTGIASGIVTGGAGALFGSPITGIGNSLYFNDPKYSFEQYGKDILMGAVLGGVISGGVAAWKGQNLWWGNTVRPITPSVPSTTPSGRIEEVVEQGYRSEPTVIDDANRELFNQSKPGTAFSSHRSENVIITSRSYFSILDWGGYPLPGIRPTGPFNLIEGAEYEAARKLANATNAAIHRANPQLKGMQIHEIHPVKFGGSPTDLLNKVYLSQSQHTQYTNFWNTLMRQIKK